MGENNASAALLTNLPQKRSDITPGQRRAHPNASNKASIPNGRSAYFLPKSPQQTRKTSRSVRKTRLLGTARASERRARLPGNRSPWLPIRRGRALLFGKGPPQRMMRLPDFPLRRLVQRVSQMALLCLVVFAGGLQASSEQLRQRGGGCGQLSKVVVLDSGDCH